MIAIFYLNGGKQENAKSSISGQEGEIPWEGLEGLGETWLAEQTLSQLDPGVAGSLIQWAKPPWSPL